MKRVVAIFLACLLLCVVIPMPVHAEEDRPRIVVEYDKDGFPVLTCEKPSSLADDENLRYVWYYMCIRTGKMSSRYQVWAAVFPLTEIGAQYKKTLRIAECLYPSTSIGRDTYRFRCDVYYLENARWVKYTPAAEGTEWLKLPGAQTHFWVDWPSWIQEILYVILFGWLWMEF